MKKLTILLADDHKIMRDGLKLLIDGQPDLQVIGEACNGREAVSQARVLRPDVVVMDLSMPEINGLQATEALRNECPEARVLILTTHEDETYLRQVCKANASGFVLKRSPSEELIAAIRKVAAGGVHLDATLAKEALASQLRESKPTNAPENAELSEREREVLRGIAWGFSNKEIANKLDISVKTVETYKVRVGDKLGLRSRAEMVQYAAARGWLSGEQAFMQKSN